MKIPAVTRKRADALAPCFQSMNFLAITRKLVDVFAPCFPLAAKQWAFAAAYGHSVTFCAAVSVESSVSSVSP